MFDPYREWLGISDERRPPTLYQLLGIAAEESSPPAIDAAAARQLSRLQGQTTGSNSKVALRLIDEINLAKSTLLDPAKRAAYDAIFGAKSKRSTTIQMGSASPPAPARSHSLPPQTAPSPAPAQVQPSPPKPIPARSQPSAPQYNPSSAAVSSQPYPPTASPWSEAIQPPAVSSSTAFETPSSSGDLFQDHNPPSSDGFPSATTIARPKIWRGGSGFTAFAVGMVILGLTGASVYVVKTRLKSAPDPITQLPESNHDLADNGNKTGVVQPQPIKEEETKHNRDTEEPKRKDIPITKKELPKIARPEKKKLPAKIDPAPPIEVRDEFRETRVLRGHESAPKSIAIAADGKQVLSTGDDLAVNSWVPDKDRPARRLTLMSPPGVGVGLLPGGKQAIAVDGGFIYVFDLLDNTVRKKIVTAGGGFLGVAIGPDGIHVATCSNDGKLRWWDLGKDLPERTIAVSEKTLDCVALSSDGKSAVAGGSDGRIAVCDVSTGKILKKWVAHAGGVSSVGFSPDGKYIVSGGEDKLGKVWVKDTFALAFTLTGHTGPVTGVAYTIDGKMIITTGDTTIRSWDGATGEPLRWSMVTESPIRSLAVDPKNRYVVAGLMAGGLQMAFLPAVRPNTPPRVSQVQPGKMPLQPVPAASAVESEVMSLREKYKNDYAQSGTDDQIALYDKLLAQARFAALEPASRYAHFQEARDIAAKMGRMLDSFKAITARSAWFDVDDLVDKAASLKAAIQGTVARNVAEAALSVVEEAERRARPDIVDELLRQRELFPQLPDAPELSSKIQAADKRWIAGAAERDAMRNLADDLKKDPNIPAANVQYGKYLCFRVGNWADGLTRFIRGDDAALKELARKELADPKDAKSLATMGNSWLNYALKADDIYRPGILIRAKYWLEKAVAGDLPAAEKLAIGKRLNEINKHITAVAGVALYRPGETVVYKGFNTIRSHIAVETQWSLVGSSGFTPDGVILKANASITSRFRVLDGCQVEFALTPDGRELKVLANGTDTPFMLPNEAGEISLLVARKGNEIKFAVKNRMGKVEEEKSAPIASGQLDPSVISIVVSGAENQRRFLIKSVMVSGPVRPIE